DGERPVTRAELDLVECPRDAKARSLRDPLELLRDRARAVVVVGDVGVPVAREEPGYPEQATEGEFRFPVLGGRRKPDAQSPADRALELARVRVEVVEAFPAGAEVFEVVDEPRPLSGRFRVLDRTKPLEPPRRYSWQQWLRVLPRSSRNSSSNIPAR